MQYMLLIYSNEAAAATAGEAEMMEVMKAYNDFTAAVHARGIFKGGDALHDTSKATTVRTKDGKHVLTDGPFAETKEQLGGFYLVDVKDLDEALEIAKMCPGSKWGAIEVRPVMVFS